MRELGVSSGGCGGFFRYLSVLLEFHYLFILRTESTEYLSIKPNTRIMLPKVYDTRTMRYPNHDSWREKDPNHQLTL